MVTSPIATTQKFKQVSRMQTLIEKAQAELPPAELESLSNQVIDWIQSNACQELGNREKLSLLKEPKRGKNLKVVGRSNGSFFFETPFLYVRRVQSQHRRIRDILGRGGGEGF